MDQEEYFRLLQAGINPDSVANLPPEVRDRIVAALLAQQDGLGGGTDVVGGAFGAPATTGAAPPGAGPAAAPSPGAPAPGAPAPGAPAPGAPAPGAPAPAPGSPFDNPVAVTPEELANYGNPGVFGSYGPLTSGYNDPNNPFDNAINASNTVPGVGNVPGYGYGTPAPSATPPAANQEQYGPATPPGFGLETYGPPVEGAFGPAGNYGYGSQPASAVGTPGTPFGGGVFGGVTPASVEDLPGWGGFNYGGLEGPMGGPTGFGTGLGGGPPAAPSGYAETFGPDDPVTGQENAAAAAAGTLGGFAGYGSIDDAPAPEGPAGGYGGYGESFGGGNAASDAAAAAANEAAAAEGTATGTAGYGDVTGDDAPSDDAPSDDAPGDDDDDDDDDGDE